MATLLTTINSITLLSSSPPLLPHRTNNFISTTTTTNPSTLSSSSSSCYGFAQFSTSPLHHHHLQKMKMKSDRGALIVTRGAPSTNSLIFAFVFPLSLIIATVISASKMADKLDEDFLEELAINQAIMEESGMDEDSIISLEERTIISMEEKAAAGTPRTRNRPKREA